MLTVRPAYVPVFAPHRVQQTARVGGVFTGVGAIADRVVFASIITLFPTAVGAIVFGPTGAMVGFGIGAVASLPVLFGG